MIINIKSLFDYQFIMFIVIGIVNTIITLLVIWLLMFFGFGDIFSNATGYICGVVTSYLLNRKITFHYKKSSFNIFVRFLFVIIISYLLNLSIVVFCIKVIKINRFIAQICGMPFYTLFSFCGCKYYVFPKRKVLK